MDINDIDVNDLDVNDLDVNDIDVNDLDVNDLDVNDIEPNELDIKKDEMINKLSKIERIKKYRESLLPTLYNIQDKTEAIISALEDGSTDCEILNDSKTYEFNQLMLEMEILQNDITRLDFELNNYLISTATLLGTRYFEKLAEFQKESDEYYARTVLNDSSNYQYSEYNNSDNNKKEWKKGLSKWIIPLFFYISMMGDENSILNSPKFDKEYINKENEKELVDGLKDDGYNVKCNNGVITSNDISSNINSLD
jgi:hypothetical protein